MPILAVRRASTLAVAFLSLSLAGLSRADMAPDPATLPHLPAELLQPFASVDEGDLRAWVEFLSSEELEGRGAGERGYDVASRFAASSFRASGLTPAGDRGGWFQEFEIVRSSIDSAASGLEVADGSGKERLAVDGNLALAASGDLEWPPLHWTFVGHGEAGEGATAGDLDGVPAAERVVVVLPKPGVTSRESRGAVAAGAKRIVIISDERVRSGIGLRDERPAFQDTNPSFGLPPGVEVVYLTRAIANRLFRSRGVTVESLLAGGRPGRFELDAEVRLTVKRRREVVRTRNVVGLLEGSDPELKQEAVVIGAHLDHLGLSGGKLHPGADDDASGSCGVLSMAKALGHDGRRTSRSIVFVLFAAEEKGLWGSRWFVDHPPLPLPKVMAELQLDMIGRDEEANGVSPSENRNSVHLVGSQRRSLDLHRTILAENRFVGLRIVPGPENFYGSSDQYHFGERGVPVAFFFTGMHPDYHRPSDTAEKLDYAKMARVIRLVLATAVELAERREPLRATRRV